jgi:hypothetical protein
VFVNELMHNIAVYASGLFLFVSNYLVYQNNFQKNDVHWKRQMSSFKKLHGNNVSPVCVTSFYNQKISSYGDLASKNHLAYCDKHGYRYFLFTENSALNVKQFKDSLRPWMWLKVEILHQMLVKHPDEFKCDWVLWIDADAVFTNWDGKVELLIEKLEKHYSDVSVVVARQDVVPDADKVYHELNSGVVLVARNENGVNLVDHWKQSYPHYKDSYLVEQAALNDIVYKRSLLRAHGGFQFDRSQYDPRVLFPGVVIVPNRVMNSFAFTYYEQMELCGPKWHWSPGDYILHLARTSATLRKEVFNSYYIQEAVPLVVGDPFDESLLVGQK